MKAKKRHNDDGNDQDAVPPRRGEPGHSLIPYTQGDKVTESIGNQEGAGGCKRESLVVRNDEHTCSTDTGHRFTRQEGRCLTSPILYRAIGTPNYVPLPQPKKILHHDDYVDPDA